MSEELQRKSIFRTHERGWMGFGLRPLEVWSNEVYNEFLHDRPATTECANDFKNFLRRNVRMSPGTAAGAELCLKSNITKYMPYTRDFLGRWRTDSECEEEDPNNFENSMVQMAIASTRFTHSMIESWKQWCVREGKGATRESFTEFGNSCEIDIFLSAQIMERMTFFCSAFPQIYSNSNNNVVADDLTSLTDISFDIEMKTPPISPIRKRRDISDPPMSLLPSFLFQDED